MSEKSKLATGVVALSCLVLLMRGGVRENVESQLSALQGFRQLTKNYRDEYCDGKGFSISAEQRDRYKSEKKVMKE